MERLTKPNERLVSLPKNEKELYELASLFEEFSDSVEVFNDIKKYK